MEPNFIDAHVHVWTSDVSHFPRHPRLGQETFSPANFSPERLLAIAEPLGLKRFVLVQMSFYGTDNSYMLDVMRRYPGVFSGIAIVDYDAPTLEEEMTRLASLSIRGFRISQGERNAEWLDTVKMHNFWRLAAAKQLAICPLINPYMLSAVDHMCARFPETIIVIDHMARIGMDGVLRDGEIASLVKLARHPRVYVKISAFYALGEKQHPYIDLISLVRRLYDAYGPRRLMWGSDSPFQVEKPHSYAGSLELVRQRLEFLAPEDPEWLLRRSAEAVFF